jgi:hypothetical protein
MKKGRKFRLEINQERKISNQEKVINCSSSYDSFSPTQCHLRTNYLLASDRAADYSVEIASGSCLLGRFRPQAHRALVAELLENICAKPNVARNSNNIFMETIAAKRAKVLQISARKI